MKKCFKCHINKNLNDFYKHSTMSDGHLNKCKDCTKKDVNIRETNLRLNDAEWLKKERKRCREKIRKSEKIPINKEKKAASIRSYHIKFPEKRLALIKSQHVVLKTKGNESHHWSYNEKHFKDIIELSVKEHKKLHRYIIYDKEMKMYRTLEGDLLNTKEVHISYFNKIKHLE